MTRKKPISQYIIASDEACDKLDLMINQYNKDNNKSLSTSKEIIEKSYNAGRVIAENVLKEYPNFPEDFHVEIPHAYPNVACEFYWYCNEQTSDTDLLTRKSIRDTYQNFVDTCKNPHWADHTLNDVLGKGELVSWEDVWEEHCNKPEDVNKL